MKANLLVLVFATAVLAQQQLATSQSTDPAQNQNPNPTAASEIKDAQQSTSGKQSLPHERSQ